MSLPITMPSTQLTPEGEKRAQKLVPYHLLPDHMQENPYLLSGYRSQLPIWMCIRSIFWWTNETINIWSHLLGGFLPLCFMFYDLDYFHSTIDQSVLITLYSTVSICLWLSAAYHTLSCANRGTSVFFYTLDNLGIATVTIVMIETGIYIASDCFQKWMPLYLIGGCVMYAVIITVQLMKFKFRSVGNSASKLPLVGLVACCVIPMIHWYQVTKEIHGSELAIGWILKVVSNLMIFLVAFILYIFSIPERLVKGTFDYVGSSHQLWHFLTLYGFYRFRVLMLDYHENDEIHHCDKWLTFPSL